MPNISSKYRGKKTKSEKVKILDGGMWKCKGASYSYVESLIMIYSLKNCVVRLKHEKLVEIKVQELQLYQRVTIKVNQFLSQAHKEDVKRVRSQKQVLKLRNSSTKVMYFYVIF